MKKHIQIYVLLLLSIFHSFCNGQDKPSIESKDIINAFNAPNSITRTIKQDRKGNIWFASWEGIIRYDGNSFTNITEKKGLSPCHAFAILEDRKGNIWIGTMGEGVYRYDGKSFSNFTTKEGLASNRVGYIYEDKAGNIWFGTEGGASCYNGEIFRNFTMKDGLNSNDVNCIIEDTTGKLWFATREDAYFYDGKTFTKFNNKKGVPFKNVRLIIEDKKGNIWFGGKDGLWRYNGNSLTNFTTDFVGYIYEDKKGNIWTSSESSNIKGWALSRYDENSLYNDKATVTELKTIDGMFFGILEDSNENIWVGTLNGIYRYDGNTFNDFKDTRSKE